MPIWRGCRQWLQMTEQILKAEVAKLQGLSEGLA